MGRGYKRKREKRNADVIREAVLAIHNGMSLRAASRYFGIPKTTLFNHRRSIENYKAAASLTTSMPAPALTETRKMALNDIKIVPVGRSTVFTKEQENALEEYLLHCSEIYSELRSKDARIFAFEYATELNVDIPDSWKVYQLAGREWFRGFMLRHPRLSITKPELASLEHMTAFNQANMAVRTTTAPPTTVTAAPQLFSTLHTVCVKQGVVQSEVDAFTNHMKLNMYKIIDEELQDELQHKIQNFLYEYKNKQRALNISHTDRNVATSVFEV